MITLLAGGVGGAKLAEGLNALIPAGELTVIVNTGDDLLLHGLRISPDLDTITYTLGGCVNRGQGWGRAGDTWNCLQSLEGLGAPAWFRLGDRDLATHLFRTSRLAQGESLTQVTTSLCGRLGVKARVLPMSDQYAPTYIVSDDGEMHVQEYLIRFGCAPRVCKFRYHEIESCRPAPGVLRAIASADRVILAPSNPFISLGPILAVPGIRAALQQAAARVVAVSPLIGGKAVKGPAAKMMQEQGHPVSAAGVAGLYRGLVQTFVVDEQDAALLPEIAALNMHGLALPILMRTHQDKLRLAEQLLEGAGN